MHRYAFRSNSKVLTIQALLKCWALVFLVICLWLSNRPQTIAIANPENPSDIDCSIVTEIPQAECEALVALYDSTDGPNWTNNSDWQVTTTLCSWYGVSCYAGSVYQIDLTSNQLNGSLPPELANLTNLRYLYLRSNQLSGSIPIELGNLTSLESLSLYSNQLSGSIPPELGNLAALQHLFLDDNQLSGSIPVDLMNLTALVDNASDFRHNLLYKCRFRNHRRKCKQS